MKAVIVIIGVFFVLATLFDVGVTYSMYQKYGDNFMNMEMNEILVTHLEKGGNFWTSPFSLIFVVMTALYLPFAFYLTDMSRKYPTFMVPLVALFTIYVFAGFAHIYGGLTWFIYGYV